MRGGMQQAIGEAMHVAAVKAERWGATGYRDALNRNAPWIPHDADRATREAYLAGYECGVVKREADK